jgi:hypothetical protein
MLITFSKLPTALAIGLAATLVSCEALKGPKAVSSKKLDLPGAFSQAKSGQNAEISTGWIEEFRDSRMTKVVKDALVYNQGLKAGRLSSKGCPRGSYHRPFQPTSLNQCLNLIP